MTLKQRLEGIVRLGTFMRMIGTAPSDRQDTAGFDAELINDFDELIVRQKGHNGWFTEANVRRSILAHGEMLEEDALNRWLDHYPQLSSHSGGKRIGVIMAGNIPIVGFHDALCILLTGNSVVAKCSSDDALLIPALMSVLSGIEPEFKDRFSILQGKLEGHDAMIATGSNNSARYFEHYFGNVPNIIRKNRTSLAVLQGDESEEDLAKLGEDVFTYFGLGCRNVTKVLIPQDFDLDRIFGALYPFHNIVEHNKYANNYDYHKALWLLNRDDLLENGFLLVKEDEQLVSPVGSLFYQRYSKDTEIEKYINENSEAIQCVVGKGYLPFGSAQNPGPMDYADNVDTIQFLLEL